MMKDAILNFQKQFLYEPKIENKSNLKKHSSFVLLGMGGSHLAADIVHSYNPDIPLIIHSDYGLPGCDLMTLKNSLVIASSYSGNTEEVIEGLEIARKKKLDIAVIAVGGKLLELAKKYHLPYIQLPNTGIQPRSALGFSLMSLLSLMNQKNALREAKKLAQLLKPKSIESLGKSLAQKLQNAVPVVYSSTKNQALAYNWKIKLNETGKIPAFYNILPELNHNEMPGFDVVTRTRQLSSHFIFLFLTDSTDHPKNQKRMKIVQRLYQKRGLKSTFLPLKGKTRLERIFSSLLLADWTSVYLAAHYGLESEQVPMVEEFKKMIG